MLTTVSVSRPRRFIGVAKALFWACQVSVKSPQSRAEQTPFAVSKQDVGPSSPSTLQSTLSEPIKSGDDAFLLRHATELARGIAAHFCEMTPFGLPERPVLTTPNTKPLFFSHFLCLCRHKL